MVKLLPFDILILYQFLRSKGQGNFLRFIQGITQRLLKNYTGLVTNKSPILLRQGWFLDTESVIVFKLIKIHGSCPLRLNREVTIFISKGTLTIISWNFRNGVFVEIPGLVRVRSPFIFLCYSTNLSLLILTDSDKPNNGLLQEYWYFRKWRLWVFYSSFNNV